MSNELEDLLAEYWDAAYAEGASGRDHDTTDGRAQRALSALRGHCHAILARVARLEEALQKIANGCGMIPDKSTVYMSGKSPEVPKIFNVYDMREIASRTLEEK